MPATFEIDRKKLLVFAALLEGCGYYGCKDKLKQDYVPQQGSSRWQDAKTLELDFGAALRPPDEVDPGRFALLRYNVKIGRDTGYYCYFDLCYQELNEVAAIPESLDWDPAEPQILRLHFAEPIPASSCEPWSGNRADFQALELIYLGTPDQRWGETDSGEVFAEPDQLAYADDEPIEELGPNRALQWLDDCLAGSPCELEEFCIDRGGFDEDPRAVDLWVDCP